jgi:hypothetical protein
MSMIMNNEIPKHECQVDNLLFVKTKYIIPSIINTSNNIIIFCMGNVMFEV